jgi:glycerol kinase
LIDRAARAGLVRPKITETTALGAAYAAGLAVGFWTDIDSLRRNWQQDRAWLPKMPAAQRDECCRQWKKAIERSLGWID